ncbi:unnamed protein product [Brassica oleracea var. botrytis]
MYFGIIGAKIIESLVTDTRFMSYIPSVFATAIMIHVIKDLKPREQVEYQSHQLMTLLKVNQQEEDDELARCFDLDDSSNGSWNVSAASVSSSEEPPLKRRRVHEQQMRLPSINHM